MRIFIGTEDVCGVINIYANELRARGHEVTTFVNMAGNRFYSRERYDISGSHILNFILGRSADSPLNFAMLTISKIINRIRLKTGILNSYFIKKIIEQHELFLFIWAGNYVFNAQGGELEVLKRKNKKIISVLVGSDVRDLRAFEQQFSLNIDGLPEEMLKLQPPHFMKLIRTIENNSDLVLSVPDQMGLAIKPYSHFQIPLDLNRFKFTIPDRDIPLVVHAPSTPAKKGTDVILSTLQILKEEGYEFELKFIQNMQNDELLGLLSEADILVDELIFHGPGSLSLEAMASGCAVATRYFVQSPPCFRPPVVAITVENIYENLKKMLSDKAYRTSLAYAGREYVEKNNTVGSIVDKMFEGLDSPKPDYAPSFFIDEFNLPQGIYIDDDLKLLNKQALEKWVPESQIDRQRLTSQGLI